MLVSLQAQTRRQELSGEPAVLLVSPVLRRWLAQFVRGSVPGLNVLSYNEVPRAKQIKVIATIGGESWKKAG